jgi:SOS-response transcriptional repressor LexA
MPAETVRCAPPQASKLSYGERIMQVLREQRRSKVWLAEQTGLSKQNLNYLLRHANSIKHASTIAECLGIHTTWLTSGLGGKYRAQRQEFIRVPVLPLQINSQNIQDSHNKTNYLIANNKIDAACFAIKLNNKSMEPEFKAGSYLIFDPNKEIAEACFVCMSLKNKPGLLFRQYHVDGADVYFKTLNDMYRIIQNEPFVIHGVLIEDRREF